MRSRQAACYNQGRIKQTRGPGQNDDRETP